jgi:hypothetical protein
MSGYEYAIAMRRFPEMAWLFSVAIEWCSASANWWFKKFLFT